ncbi:hypothetical protein A2U01_0117148, partial [Trifolium medium]|nr:hypothetical protein [Trifolium medium]
GFERTLCCAIDVASEIVSNEQNVHLNTPGRIVLARQFERVVGLKDDRRVGADGYGVVAGVVRSS